MKPPPPAYNAPSSLNSKPEKQRTLPAGHGQWSNNQDHHRPLPQILTWRFVPLPTRSLIYKKSIRRRRRSLNESDVDLKNKKRPVSSNLALRIKHNVFSRRKSKAPRGEFPDITIKPRNVRASWDEKDYKDNNNHNDKNDQENNEAELELGSDVYILPAENGHSQEGPLSTPTLIPYPLLSSDDDSPLRPDSYSSGSACVTAGSALAHAVSKEMDMRDILVRSCCEGSYLIQAGFNQEMLDSNQGLLQEIYLFLQCELHSLKAKQIATIFSPFPVIIYTPNATYQYPPLQETEYTWNLWRRHGIFRPDIQEQRGDKILAPSDTGENSMKSTGSTSGSSDTGTTEGESDSPCGNQDEYDRGGGDDNDSSSEGSRERDDEDGNADNLPNLTPKAYRDACSTREVSIPFSSTLTVSGENYQPSTRYKTNASIDIKIEDNPESRSRPPGLNWGGPWIEAKFALLDAEMHVIPKGKLGYHLGLAQIRIMASGCTTSVLSYSPTILRVDGDNVKSIMEKNNSASLKATIGTAPTLRLEGTTSQASSEERSQKRWEVIAHCIPSDRDDNGKSRTTMMWKYVHNDGHYTPEIRNVFEPRPSAVFGLSRTSPTMPELDIEVVMYYSWSNPPQTYLDWIRARSKPKTALPAFSNFLHRVSITLDLTQVTERTEWIVGLNAEDRHKISEIGMEARPILRRLESNTGASGCPVLLRRALHGHICLTEEQKKEYKTDPFPLLSMATPRKQEAEDALALDSLPTPSPSPSPTSSVVNNKYN